MFDSRKEFTLSDAFIGYNDDTCPSIIMYLLHEANPDYDENEVSFLNCAILMNYAF